MKQLRRMATVGALLAAIGTTAEAQVNFIGATDFCWSALGGTPTCPAFGSPASLGGLTLTSGSFDVLTNASGFAAIGGETNSLGSVSLDNSVFNYGAGFELFMDVEFSAPALATSSTFTSRLVGTVGAGDAGGVFIAWNPGTLLGTYEGGTYELFVNNVTVTPGQSNVLITGAIFSYPVPEPATGALLVMGLSLMSMVAARRRAV
jgi:hypothetical protein